MADFNEQLPQWDAAGIEPPATKKTNGWAVDDKPPAGWLNWLFNRIYKVVSEIRTVFSAHKADNTAHITGAERTTWNNKVDKVAGKQLSTEDYSTTEKNKLAGIAASAEVNQNAFTTVAVSGQSSVVADSKTDTLTIAAGTGITVTTDANTDTITVTATGNQTPGAHASSHLTGGSDPIAKATTSTDGLMPASAMADLAAVKAGQGRVDLSQTLGPGLSVLAADQNGSELDLVVSGRTLVNILGNSGNFELDSNSDGVANGWTKFTSGTYSLETTNVSTGLKAQKITSTAGDPNVTSRNVYQNIAVEAGKTYVAVANLATDGITIGMMRIELPTLVDVSQSTSGIIFIKFTPSTTGTYTFRLFNRAVVGDVGWVQFDSVGIYEVDAALYARIGVDITAANIRDYLPHVDGKQHVQGVAITKQGRNLLPSVPEGLNAAATTNGPYDLTMVATGPSQTNTMSIPVIPGQTYTVSIEMAGSNALLGYNFYDSNGTQVGSYGTWLGATGSKVFTVPANVTRARVVLNSNGAGTLTFKNWMLVLGDASALPPSFTPTEPQSVVLPVTLGQVGDVKDSVYNSGTEWMYVERIKKNVLLDGAISWVFDVDYAGFKRVKFNNGLVWASTKGTASRYDGKLLKNDGTKDPSTEADTFLIHSSGYFFLNIADTDSGWAEAINPNSNAIKALANGWKANANNGTVYTSWISILDGSAPATNTEAWVAANKAPGWTAWASLDYALANATAPVPVADAEGSITLHPGGNQISVDTGVIQREKATFAFSGTAYRINQLGFPASASLLSKRGGKLLAVYKEEDLFTKYGVINDAAANGNFRIGIEQTDYDPTKDYYVTYIALDKYALTSSVTETIATYRTGLGGVASDLVQSVAELRQADDRQDFAIDYAEAKTDNLRVDFTAHQVDYIRHPAYAGTAGTATAYTATLSPAPASLPEGFGITIVPHAANGANPTLNINGLGAVALKDQKGVSLAAGFLVLGYPYSFRKIGSDFRLDNGNGVINPWGDNTSASRPIVWASRNASNQSCTSMAWTNIIFDTTSTEQYIDYNATTGAVTIQQSGWYKFYAKALLQGYAANNQAQLRFLHNVVTSHTVDVRIQATLTDLLLNGEALLFCNSGDVLNTQVYVTSNATVRMGSDVTVLQVVKVA
ncbi:hypothetical protein [Paenibacillus rhizophilus]|uniref:Tail fiber protein n=1 Tax=Paenibacillus rhizophilus TaxID=1850366 RepID=A0A3N9PZL4_9BACL|nr:hypothetical protein [Paenibacillus rhizophilus]RQW11852.1 hypothetical protein EH198_09255 [Paenibacillus rhizophilus]